MIESGFDTNDRKNVYARFILKKIDALLDKTSAIKTGKSVRPLAAGARKAPAQNQRCHTTVVYVDDSPVDSQAMGEIVQGAGYSYANISDPLQALSQLMDYSPKLIFLELALPVANGYELCAQIRRMSLFQETPIIIVTRNDRLADRVRAKIVGASGFLSKPIRAQPVLKVLIKQLACTTAEHY